MGELATPKNLTRPLPEETLYLYMVVSKREVSVVLIREQYANQSLVYPTIKALARPKTHYQKIEKVSMELITRLGKLQRNFLAHSTIFRMNLLLKQVLYRPDLVGKFTKFVIKLSKCEVSFEARKELKAQIFANFL